MRAIVLAHDDAGTGGEVAQGPDDELEAGTGAGQERGAASVVVPNPEAGILLVRAPTRRHREVQTYLDEVLASVRRQVLVEATIVEVELSERFQAGVDWERLARNGGVGVNQSLLAGNLAAPPFFALSYENASLGTDGEAARGVRQGPGALEPEARGPEQSDRGAEGDPATSSTSR